MATLFATTSCSQNIGGVFSRPHLLLSPTTSVHVRPLGRSQRKERRRDGQQDKISAVSSEIQGDAVLIQDPTKVLRHQRRATVRANASGEAGDGGAKLAPLIPESPAGQLLVNILQMYPHLFPAAAEQELEKISQEIQEESEAESSTGKDGPKLGSMDLVLQRRITELKAAERKRAMEEVIYAMVIARFIEVGVNMAEDIHFIPAEAPLPIPVPQRRGPSKDAELLAIHSKEAQEMVREHLSMILGVKGVEFSPIVDDRILVQTSKFRMGQVYAASVMYGYFLRRVDQRFQLERSMRSLAGGALYEMGEEDKVESKGAKGEVLDEPLSDDDRPTGEGIDLAAEFTAAAAAMSAGFGLQNVRRMPGFEKLSELRRYVMSFDPQTLQDAGTMRSKEVVNVIEKHTEALFGKPEISPLSEGGLAMVKDDAVRVTLSAMRHLILEAVAFGSFLWEIESEVENHVPITKK